MPDPASAPDQAGAPATSGPSNLLLRIASAAVLAPVALVAAWLDDWLFALFWTAAAVAVLWEWIALVAGPARKPTFSASGSAMVAAGVVAWLHRPIAALLLIGLGALAAGIFAPRERRLWVTAGIGYAGVLLLAPVILRDDLQYGFAAIVFLFAIVWTTDIAAYFAGRAFGGPKLCPAISPKKTWSGAIAGAFGATIAGVLVVRWFGSFNPIAVGVIALFLSAVSQLGDLLESWIKRRFGAKDASHLIPGHGGVMDRLDGFWAAAFAACVIGLLRGGLDAPARGLLVW
ncbi:MAG: phosphatidate cytidylyltransferase [Pseudolabrys sp.]